MIVITWLRGFSPCASGSVSGLHPVFLKSTYHWLYRLSLRVSDVILMTALSP